MMTKQNIITRNESSASDLLAMQLVIEVMKMGKISTDRKGRTYCRCTVFGPYVVFCNYKYSNHIFDILDDKKHA